jgi:CDP-diacylglycerol--glycerol-3-phosphate 3-phosphatidyltransferase
VAALFRCGCTANHVTLTAAILSLALGAGLLGAARAGAWHWFLLLPPWCLLRMALNAIDGMLAREYAQRSAPT